MKKFLCRGSFMPVEVKVQVRFNDLDAYGHVNNTNYLDFMEYARTNSFGPMVEEGLKTGIWYIVASINIKYKKPILFGEDVYVKVWVSEAKGAKFTIRYVIHDGKGKTFAVAESVHAALNSALGVPVRVSEEILSKVENYEI